MLRKTRGKKVRCKIVNNIMTLIHDVKSSSVVSLYNLFDWLYF